MKVIAVMKTHCDLGFTGLFGEVMERYGGEMLEEAVKICREAERAGKPFVWTMPAWPLAESLRRARPELKAEAERMARKGMLACHALPFTVHTEFLGLEELNRAFSSGKSFCDTYCRPYPVSAKMTDVPGHTRYLASALAKAGVKFLHLGANPGSRPVEVPRLFWWEGPDGGRVLTWYSRGGYGTSLLPPDDWDYPVWPAILVTNDNTGPLPAKEAEALERRVIDAYPDGAFTVGTLDDVYFALSACDLTSLPVVKSDLADSWIHGVGSYPGEVSALRRNRGRLLGLEKLAALRGAGEAANRLADAAYEAALLFGEHTWGLNVITELGYDRCYDREGFLRKRSRPNCLRMEQSWSEQSERAVRAIRETDKLQTLLEQDLTGDGLTVFNQSAAPFSGYVELPKEIQAEHVGGVTVLAAADKTYAHLSIPPLSALSLPARKGGERKEETLACRMEDGYAVLENDFLLLRVSAASGLAEYLYDKRLNRNFLRGFGAYRYDVCSEQDITDYLKRYAYYYYDWVCTAHGRMGYPTDLPHGTWAGEAQQVTLERNAVCVRFKADGTCPNAYGNAERVTVFYTLLGDSLSVRVEVAGKQASPLVEGQHFCMAFDLDAPRITVNKLGAEVDIAQDIAEGANHSMYCLEHWVDVSDAAGGVTVCSLDAPLFSVGEQAVYRFSPRYEEGKEGGGLYFNLSNNMWGTNFPQWIEGDFSYEFRLIPHGQNGRSHRRRMNAAGYPPVVLRGAGSGKQQPPIRVRGAELALLREENGSYLARIRETAGRRSLARVTGRLASGCWQTEDLMGRRGERRQAGADGFTIRLAPYECVTVRLEERT